MRSVRRLAVVVLASAASLAACRSTLTPLNELEDARSLWARSGLKSYDYTLRYNCFCSAEFASPVLVSVRNGVVTARRRLATGAEIGPSEQFPTVEGLFAIIDDARARDADWMRTEYDPRFGVPLVVFIDYESGTADEEMGFFVQDFTPR